MFRLFKLISEAAAELAPHLQIIIMDHADLKQIGSRMRSWIVGAGAKSWCP